MKRILVTGASGFVGRHCLPLLDARGYEVHAVSIKAEDATRNIHWHRANLLVPSEAQELVAGIKPTHMLHFAWYAEPKKYWTSPENLQWVQASLELLRVFVLHGGTRVVMAGSCAEYDWRYGYCSEQTTPLLPASLYGVCKHALHIMLEAFSRETGLSSAWGRIFFLYGPNEHPDRLVSSVIRSLLQKKPALCTQGNQIRDFLHVEDAASAFIALLDSNVRGPVNIASGLPVEIKQVVHTIADKLDAMDLVQLGARSESENDPALLLADVSRLKNEVSWRPKFDLNKGIEQTIDWWKRELRQS
jgi:nucleoside-diphosphate-sugar epimerase